MTARPARGRLFQHPRWEFPRWWQGCSLEAVQEIADGLRTEDAINIQYTPGQRASPRGATLSHLNILNNGFLVGEICRYTEADRICIPVPSITASVW